MKPMTEKEALSALKKAFPWTRRIYFKDMGSDRLEWKTKRFGVVAASRVMSSDTPREAMNGIAVAGYGHSMRAAVRNAIATWNRMRARRKP